MENCSPSPGTQEMQTRTTWECHLTATKLSEITEQKMPALAVAQRYEQSRALQSERYADLF